MEFYNKPSTPVEVNTASPCIHCGKPDWCYVLEELSICKREAEPAPGWRKTTKHDSEGSYYYAPIQPNKSARPAQKRSWDYPARDGSPLIQVRREDYGDERKAKIRPWRWTGETWVEGYEGHVQRADIPVYQLNEVRTAIAVGKPVFVIEGEPCADALRALGFAATTNLGGAKKWRDSDSVDLAGASVILCPDRDEPGLAHMERIARDFPDAAWLYAFPESPLWDRLPKSKGLDIADWISEGATAEKILSVIESQRIFSNSKKIKNEEIFSRVHTREENLQNLTNFPNLTPPPAEEIFTQKAEDALYSEPWISLNSSLYRWVGTHYELSPNPKEKARIAQWCNSTPVLGADKIWRYSYAKATFIEGIWNWLILKLAVAPDSINPPGINCLNGFLEISWRGSIASWQLLPHDPARHCTYVSEIEFNPDIDAEDCEKLLACLDEPQRRLFIQTLAASLDLTTIRRYRGRAVRALLCKGHGNNGKDSLREAVRLLYGVGLSNATISDFQTYDQGRKFSLAKLENARINWSSENSSFSNLDGLQSLKAAITGDPLDIERKFADEQEMSPTAIFLFNINEAPNLKAGLEAIQSRWAVLSFGKTYKIGADPTKGELEADSRFRYDPDFLKSQVVPALLNKMLAELNAVAAHGIDYRCTEEALQAIQQETNHLWAFVQEVGLGYRTRSRVYIKDLWECLREWYLSNGTLVVETDEKGKQKTEWNDQPRRGDKTIKSSNHVVQRFTELFPKAKRGKETQVIERKGQVFLEGIGFSGVSEANSEASEANSEASGEAVSRSRRVSEASEAVYLTSAQILKLFSKLPAEEQLAVKKALISFGDGVPETASLASLPPTERIPASPTASPTASPASPTASPVSLADSPGSAVSSPVSIKGAGNSIFSGNSSKIFPHPNLPDFKVGDRVAHNNPGQNSYNWHGTVVGFEQVGEILMINVAWEEFSKGPLAYRLCDLRHI